MGAIIIVLYTWAGYWAINKVLYEGKIVFYSSTFDYVTKKIVLAFFLGWAFIPIALLKKMFSK